MSLVLVMEFGFGFGDDGQMMMMWMRMVVDWRQKKGIAVLVMLSCLTVHIQKFLKRDTMYSYFRIEYMAIWLELHTKIFQLIVPN